MPEWKGRSRGFRGGAQAGRSGPWGRVHPPPPGSGSPWLPSLADLERPRHPAQELAGQRGGARVHLGIRGLGRERPTVAPRRPSRLLATHCAAQRPAPAPPPARGSFAQVRGLGWAGLGWATRPVWSVGAETRMGALQGLTPRQRNRAECVICCYSTRQNSVGDFGS